MAMEKIIEVAAELAPGEVNEVPRQIPTRLHKHTIIVTHDAKTRYSLEEPVDPSDVSDSVPILIVPGYGGVKPAYRRQREALVQHGRRVVTVRPIRDLGPTGALDLRHVLSPARLHSQTVYGIAKDVERRYEEPIVDLFGHSLGGLIAVKFAQKHPHRVRSVTLVSSAGVEDHNTLTMLLRVPKIVRHEVLSQIPTFRTDNEAKMLLEGLHYFLANPSRTGAEALVAANCNIKKIVKELECEHGIPVSFIQPYDDNFFNHDRSVRAAKQLNDRVFSVEGNHFAPQQVPEAVARIAVRQAAAHPPSAV